MNEPLKIVPAKSDFEIAAGLKERIVVALNPLIEIMAEAKAQGFEISFNVGQGPLGKPVLVALKVVKEYSMLTPKQKARVEQECPKLSERIIDMTAGYDSHLVMGALCLAMISVAHRSDLVGEGLKCVDILSGVLRGEQRHDAVIESL